MSGFYNLSKIYCDFDESEEIRIAVIECSRECSKIGQHINKVSREKNECTHPKGS